MTTVMIQQLYKEHLKGKGYSKCTIRHYDYIIKLFFIWLVDKKEKEDIREITKSDIYEFNCFIAEAKNKHNKKRFCAETQRSILLTLRLLFRFLLRKEYILFNPFDTLEMVRIKAKKLRTDIPEKIMHDFLDRLTGSNIFEIEDRALFELMYGTGLRVGEVSQLNITDIDLKNGRLIVREGKGKRDRIVPLGKNVMLCLDIYLSKSREKLLKKADRSMHTESLFINSRGGRMSTKTIGRKLKKYFDDNGYDVKVSPHILRHSFATHLLEHGAGLKHVKELLGHKSIESTVLYTHMSVKSLKRIMKMYHPRENELFIELSSDEQKEIEKVLTGINS